MASSDWEMTIFTGFCLLDNVFHSASFSFCTFSLASHAPIPSLFYSVLLSLLLPGSTSFPAFCSLSLSCPQWSSPSIHPLPCPSHPGIPILKPTPLGAVFPPVRSFADRMWTRGAAWMPEDNPA